MNFVQIQEITMPENVWYITQLVTDYFTKGLGHIVLGTNWCELVHVLFST